MTQQEFADLVGVRVTTIDKLERDEDAWETIGSETVDKIVAHYASMASYQPGKDEVKEMVGSGSEKKQKKRGVNCNRLMNARQKLGLSRNELAKRIGLSNFTIFKLENDETVWGTIKSDTADKIAKFYDSMVSNKQDSEEEKKPEERKVFGNWSDALITNEDGSVSVVEEKKPVSNLVTIVEDQKVLRPVAGTKLEELVSSNNLTDKDRQLLKYVEFACGQLKECKSHEDFETHIDILTRIIKKQY